jgi:Icc protein
MDKLFTFALISDTHLGKEPGYCYRNVSPAKNLTKVLSEIINLPQKPAFLIHAGDVCGDKENEPEAESYIFAQSMFAKLDIPLYYVAGNHDDPDLMRRHLSMGEKRDLQDHGNSLVYSFNFKGVLSIVLDARLEGELAGYLPAEQLGVLTALLEKTSEPSLIFLHYPPVELGSKWIDSQMLLRNRNELLSQLKKHKQKILGVFFGHAHHSLQIHHNGLNLVSCPSTIFQFSLQSSGRPLDLDPAAPLGFNLVTVMPQGIRVQTRTI